MALAARGMVAAAAAAVMGVPAADDAGQVVAGG